MDKFNYLQSINADYIDELYARYLENPESVDETWRYFFEGIEFGQTTEVAMDHAKPEPITNGHTNGHASPNGTNGVNAATAAANAQGAVHTSLESRVAELIQAYRDRGKYLANINPLQAPPTAHPALDLSNFNLTQADLGKTFNAGKLIGLPNATLTDILKRLRALYCESIAVEISHIEKTFQRNWLQDRIESTFHQYKLSSETRKHVLSRLTQSEGLERFLHTRYVAQKRFSLEGGESFIPGLDAIIETGTELGANEFVIGMAHRGRLNVLVNVFGKKPESLFTEFEGNYKIDRTHGEGDVKYHKGYSSEITTRKGKPAHLSLAYNPSHLEFVAPVVEGQVRGKQFLKNDTARTQIVPILIHGDAALAGQGVCYETLAMSQLEGYATGGSIHIVINNQVGFTTDVKDARSTPYPTDLAKMLDGPIFHVNGDDPEAVWEVCELASEYRQKFKSDVFIDLVCYRKHGHNEGDEPSFTQPGMYKKIKTHPSTREIYAKRLVTEGTLTEAEARAMVDNLTEDYLKRQAIAKKDAPYDSGSTLQGAWKSLKAAHDGDILLPVKTEVAASTLRALGEKINQVPASFKLHPKLVRFFEMRQLALKDGKGIDWGLGEALAYASLLAEGHPVRISGQDAERGTFTHRHAVLRDTESNESYTPLHQVVDGAQAKFKVYNSFLSETAVMGFEYGYSMAVPQALVIWEAQFGDFANGAQVIIDQFISAAESKWQRMSGLTLLLPHGYEGQGPEHSSARLERFLQLCGRENMVVANLTTPAQIFHALRRQVKRDFRKPLVIMSPKSLLRHPDAISTLAEFTDQGFQEILDDPTFADKKAASAVKRVLMCSGKVYYDLVKARAEASQASDIAIVRVEQLYPWPAEKLAAVLKRYPNAKQAKWVQEEPQNMGAWGFVFQEWMGALASDGQGFGASVGIPVISYAGRPVAASPAVGSPKVHDEQLKEFLASALNA